MSQIVWHGRGQLGASEEGCDRFFFISAVDRHKAATPGCLPRPAAHMIKFRAGWLLTDQFHITPRGIPNLSHQHIKDQDRARARATANADHAPKHRQDAREQGQLRASNQQPVHHAFCMTLPASRSLCMSLSRHHKPI
eukprot:752032-Hanusia_phi.AAC.3